MLFKIARRDSAIAEDLTEFVETVRKEKGVEIKRPSKGYRGSNRVRVLPAPVHSDPFLTAPVFG